VQVPGRVLRRVVVLVAVPVLVVPGLKVLLLLLLLLLPVVVVLLLVRLLVLLVLLPVVVVLVPLLVRLLVLLVLPVVLVLLVLVLVRLLVLLVLPVVLVLLLLRLHRVGVVPVGVRLKAHVVPVLGRLVVPGVLLLLVLLVALRVADDLVVEERRVLADSDVRVEQQAKSALSDVPVAACGSGTPAQGRSHACSSASRSRPQRQPRQGAGCEALCPPMQYTKVRQSGWKGLRYAPSSFVRQKHAASVHAERGGGG
jgi:hypothetical protein